jgi:hypothetical protein
MSTARTPSKLERLERIRAKRNGTALLAEKKKSQTAPSQPIQSENHVVSTIPVPVKGSLEPYIAKLERFELFSTHQCYYLVAGNKMNTQFRIIKMDRTLIEHPPTLQQAKSSQSAERAPSEAGNGKPDDSQAALTDNSHAPKPSLRPLSAFLTEDPNVYSQGEIRDMLDMIHDGNRMRRADGRPGDTSASSGGGLKPLVKAYGIVGFIRFLDCYYLTLITRRAKVGSIGGNSIYTIRVRLREHWALSLVYWPIR